MRVGAIPLSVIAAMVFVGAGIYVCVEARAAACGVPGGDGEVMPGRRLWRLMRKE